MAAELRQLLCDLWELSPPEEETSEYLSKWKRQLADLKDHEYTIGRRHLSEAPASTC